MNGHQMMNEKIRLKF